jgi:hypothetical protein
MSGNFLLRVDRNVQISPSDRDYFRVRIRVADISSGVIWDFISNACTASWKNSRDRTLPCPGRSGNENGFVMRLSPASMEDNNTYTAALWTHPYMREGGQIIGNFPALLIQSGDRLRIRVGCIFSFTRCNVGYDVYYQLLGGNRTRLLPSTHVEVYDGVLHTIYDQPIDAAFNNQYVSFIFQVTSLSRPQESAAGWLVLEIYR